MEIREVVQEGQAVLAAGADDPSRRVIEHRGGPLLVLGGPGTGKTTVLEERYLALARESSAPHRTLFLCRDRTYSSEARDRLFWKLPQRVSVEVPVYTWHALAYHLVTRFYSRLGYLEQPVLLTGPEQWGFVKELLAEESPAEWAQWGDRISDNAFVDEVADFCLRVQQRMMSSADLASLAEARPDWAGVVQFAGRYGRRLLQESRLDYAGLIAEAVRLLSDEPDVRASMVRRFPHVLVDDAQEMGSAHLRLLEGLAEATICVAGDPDSGIEKFRGAEPDWMYGFAAKFHGSEEIVLDRSYRIGAPLGPALARLVAQNEPDDGHRPLEWASDPTEFECRMYRSLWEEVEGIAREFRRLHVAEGVSFDRMAVLISQPGRLSSGMERALEASEVPYRAAFGDRALSRAPVIRPFLDLTRVALQLPGWEERVPHLLTSPLIGIDYDTMRRLEREAWRTGKTLTQVIDAAPECEELRLLLGLAVEHSASADECFWQIWSTASYFRDLAKKAIAAGEGPPGAGAGETPSTAYRELRNSLEALTALGHSLGRFVERRRGAGSMRDYLNEAVMADFGGDSWQAPDDFNGPAVSICSFHSSRGKEWDYVAVAGCLDSWIPKGSRAQGLFDPFALETPDIADRQVEALADDRRTFYVAASRARRKVMFSASSSAGGRGRPSRFLIELGGDLPEPAPPEELPPLSLGEMTAALRRTLADVDSTAAERVAAVGALSRIRDIDPSRWYGVRDWTPGAVPLVQGKLRTSYSRLSPYENCGLQYVLQSVLGLDHESTHSMKFGTWLHALFEAVHKGDIRDVPMLKAEYEKLFDEKVFPNATIARQFRKDGEQMLKVFWENEVDSHTIRCEHSFENVEIGEASLRGKIDRVDLRGKALKLTDYKTSKWAPSFRQAERSLQLAIYHLAARQDPELKQLGHPELARLVYPGAFTRAGKYQVLNQTAEQAEAVLAELPEMVRRVLEEDFNPNPEADCFFCRMKMLCPLWPAGREVPC